jgi:hypothetical protein
MASSSSGPPPWRNRSVQEDDFISHRRYQIAKREEQEWRRKQAEEIKAMLFRSPQPASMRDALKSIQPRTVSEPFEEEEEFKELEMASAQLEKSMIQMARVGNSFWGKLGQELYKGDEPNGLSSVRTTHEAIFGHSKGTTHAEWVWISKNSTVDKNGKLGYTTSREDIQS